MALPTRIRQKILTGGSGTLFSGGGSNYLIETPTGVLYFILIDSNNDPAYVKSTDYGYTWDSPVVFKNITCTQISVWYDRWTDPTGVLGDLIHVVYSDSSSDDTFYRSINTASSDALGTERTVFAGSSTAAGGAISIARMRGGNLIVCGSIDAGTEIFNKKSTDLFATSNVNIAASYEASPDQLIIMPGWGVDNQDAMCFYYDSSGTEVSVKYYDDSVDSWSETSLATTISIPTHATTPGFPHISAAVDHTNSQNLVVFWTAVDTANADLRVFKCTQSAQTETAANVVLNSTDDQGICRIGIVKETKSGLITDNWYVSYVGKSDGSETYPSTVSLYYKYTSDGGVNWSSETQFSNNLTNITWAITNPFIYKNHYLVYYDAVGVPLSFYIESPLYIPKTTGNIGG